MNCNQSLIADYKKYCYGREGVATTDEQSLYKTWEEKSYSFLQIIQVSDGTLFYDPVTIAVGSLLFAEPEGLKHSLLDYLTERFTLTTAEAMIERGRRVIEYRQNVVIPCSEDRILEAMAALKTEKKWKKTLKRSREAIS